MDSINNDIKHREATQLCVYLSRLNYTERIKFVNDVVDSTGVNRRTFFNWKYMCCRIPDFAKRAMENIAGRHIFDSTSSYT